MRFFVDRDSGKFVLGPGTSQLLASVKEIRGPAAEIEIQFLRGVTPQELDVSASGIFTVKTKNEFDSSPLTSAPAWVKTGTGVDTIYTFSLPLVNDPLDALLGVDALHAFTVVAATDLFTSTDGPHGLTALTPIQLSSTVELPTPSLPNTTYFVSATGLTATEFKISATSGGAVLNITDTGTGIHSFRRITNDVIEVTLMAALQWVADGRTNETQKIDYVLQNDVVREGEIPPAFPPLVYAVFFPEVMDMADFKAVPTIGMSLGYLVEVLIEVSAVFTWLTYRLEAGPTSESEPQHVEPNDYDLGTNDVHWNGASGPSGPPGTHAGIAYKWNTNTANTDPTSGHVKVNNATLASATALYISETDDDGNALAALLATFDDGTSTVRGRICFQDPDDPSNFVFFNITGTLTDNGGWDAFTIALVASGGTLTNNLPLRMFFFPKGDKGDTGATGPAGDDGEGVPTGGTTGQVLTKDSGTDFDTSWQTPSGGGGGFPGIPWKWGDSNTDADPSAGYFRIDDDDGTSAAFFYIADAASGGANYDQFIATQAAGNYILVYPPGLTSAQAPGIYKTTGAVTDASGYCKVPIEWVDGFFYDFSTLTLDDVVYFDFKGPSA